MFLLREPHKYIVFFLGSGDCVPILAHAVALSYLRDNNALIRNNFSGKIKFKDKWRKMKNRQTKSLSLGHEIFVWSFNLVFDRVSKEINAINCQYRGRGFDSGQRPDFSITWISYPWQLIRLIYFIKTSCFVKFQFRIFIFFKNQL